jgi:hypothetical protein
MRILCACVCLYYGLITFYLLLKSFVCAYNFVQIDVEREKNQLQNMLSHISFVHGCILQFNNVIYHFACACARAKSMKISFDRGKSHLMLLLLLLLAFCVLAAVRNFVSYK